MDKRQIKLVSLSIKPFILNKGKKRIWIATAFIALATLLVAIKLLANSGEGVKVQNQTTQVVVSESSLNTVYLNQDSYRKLGIQIAKIKREELVANKTYGGEIVMPTGGLLNVTAPISGKLISPEKNSLKPGDSIKLGQLLYRIQPIITADARANLVNALADAESLVNVAKSQVVATEIALNRAKKLLQDLVGSQRNVDDAYATHEIALRNLEAAYAKKNTLHQVVNLGTVEPIDIKAPQAGIVSIIFAIKDQLVSAGNPVIEISALNSLWVRVPIPAGDLDSIDQEQDAEIHSLADKTGAQSIVAKPTNAPPTADPFTSSTHLYYAIQNNQSALRPMQRVSVSLHSRSKSIQALSIPWSAVVFDVYGGSWVYTQKSTNLYERKRVFLDHVSGHQAIVSEGPPEGSKVVVSGALELFAVETGFSH